MSSLFCQATSNTYIRTPTICGIVFSNENAMKLLFMKYAEQERGGRTEFTEEELTSVMTGQAPGTPNMCIISFHGR